MKRMNKLILLLLSLALLIAVAGCAPAATTTESTASTTTKATTTEVERIKIKDVGDLKFKIIGVQLGTTGDTIASDTQYRAKDVERFNKYVDAITSLKQKKIDCIIMDRDTAESYIKANDDLGIVDVGFEPEQYAVAVKKGNTDLLAVVNEVIAEMKADGSLAASLEAHADQKGAAPDYNTGAAGGKLVVGTEPGFPPYEYMSGENVIGTDMDIMAKVAKKLDKELVIENLEFGGLIAAVQQGKIDAIAAGFSINEERKTNVDFSDFYVDASQVVVVRKTSMQ